MPSSRELLESHLKRYLQVREAVLAVSTLSLERRALRRFLHYLQELGIEELAAVEQEHMAGFSRHLRALPGRRGGRISDSFLQQVFLAVRGFLVWAQRDSHLLQDFRELPIPPRVDGIRPVPTVAEMRRLLECPSQETPLGSRDRVLLELLYVLGLRCRECEALDLSSFDLVAGVVNVVGKGGHERALPLSPKLDQALRCYLERSRPRLLREVGEPALLLATGTGRRLSRPSIQIRVRKYGALVGMKLHPHQLRHACATHLLEGGADPAVIARLLGHQRLSSTARYARVHFQELVREFRRCHPRALGPCD